MAEPTRKATSSGPISAAAGSPWPERLAPPGMQLGTGRLIGLAVGALGALGYAFYDRNGNRHMVDGALSPRGQSAPGEPARLSR